MTDKIETTPSQTPKARNPRGFADKRWPSLRLERHIIDTVSKVYERFGFEGLATSAFEYADALGKFLPDADRPNEGVFALLDDDEQWMALRYDHTAPLARFVAQHPEGLPKPFRRYAYGPVWRNEKPGPGRLREFWQCDADTVGSSRLEADAEIIALAVAGFGALKVPSQIRINNRKLLDGMLTGIGVHEGGQKLKVLRAMDKADRLGLEGVAALLGAGRLDESGDFTQGAGLEGAAIERVLAYLSLGASRVRADFLNALSEFNGLDEALKEMQQLDAALKAMGVDEAQAVYDVSIVRGLEYYTGPVFEAELLLKTKDERGRDVTFGSVGGGGRYDDLVARFGGASVPATGFSFGVSRLALALESAGEQGASSLARKTGPVVIVVFDQALMGDYLALCQTLRNAGIAAEVYMGAAGLKAQMKYADRRCAPFVIMMGEDEIKKGELTLKDLDVGSQMARDIADHEQWKTQRPGQQSLSRDAAISYIINHLKG